MTVNTNVSNTFCIVKISEYFILLAFILPPATIYAAEVKQQKQNLFMSVETGIAYDSNIYRSPDKTYLDYGKKCIIGTDPNCINGNDIIPHVDPNQGHTQVNPSTYSSIFIPLRFNLNHNKTLDDTNTLITNYKFNGSFYTNRNYSNADQQLHRFNIGNEKIFVRDKKQRNELYAGISLGYKKRLYVDRDTGDNQQSGPDDISDRYTYNFYGAELKYQNKKDNFKYRLQADIESRDYVKVGTVSEYDNNKIGLAGDVSWRVIKPTKLHAGLEFYNIDYVTRPSRDENGDLFKSNPARKYGYTIFSVGVRHRFNHSWLVYLDLLNKQRDDKYKGYDNYTKILYKLRIHYRAMSRLKFKLSIVSWSRDYDNAFAFDHMEYGVKKTYDATIFKLAGIYQLQKDMTLNISYLQNNQDSTDLRYVYDRAIALATFEWRF